MAHRPEGLRLPQLVSGQRALAHHDQHESERVLPVRQARLVGGVGGDERGLQGESGGVAWK